MGSAKNKALPDLHGCVVIVTGGNSGIGYETSFQLALQGARVYVAARSKLRVADAITKMKSSTQRELDLKPLDLDLASLKSVDSTAKAFMAVESRLDILINNAGVMATPYALTDSNFELQWQTNHLAPFLFTRSLLPLLISTAALSPKSPVGVRIINVSSTAAFEFVPKVGLDPASPSLDNDKGPLAPMKRYGLSKLASVIHTRALHDRYNETHAIRAYSLHPGIAFTNLQDGNTTLVGSMLKFAVRMGILPGTVSVKDAASTTLFCATNGRAKSGEFYGPGEKIDLRAEKFCGAKRGLVEKVWNESERMLSEAGF